MADEILGDEASSLNDNEEVVDTSDEALNKAAEETDEDYLEEELEEEVVEVEEEEVGEVEEEVEDLEEEDNRERTKLGRKVKAQELLMNNLNTKLDLLLAGQIEKYEDDAGEVEDDGYEDEPLTAKTLKALLPKLMKGVEGEQTAKQKTYEQGFLAEIVQQGVDLDEGVHDKITEIMLERYNKIITGDPRVDAELAFLKAERDYSQENAGGKKILRSKKAPVTDKPTARVAKKKAVNVKKLDKHAQDFISRLNLSEDFVNKTLGG